jgi:hypothetical protein
VEKQKNLGNTPPPSVAGIYGFSGEKKHQVLFSEETLHV